MLGILTLTDYIVLLGSIAAAVTAAAALVALVFAKGQVREAQRLFQQSRKVANADFLLRLDDAFQRHDAVHKRLQPAFEWGSNKGGPASAEEWFAVTSYMGLLERANYLVESGVEEPTIIDKLYGYRVYNIVSNDVIRREKLENAQTAAYYGEFIKLWNLLRPMHGDWRDFPAVRCRSRSMD